MFDRVRTCRNDCAFCFMAQLPAGLRPSLYLRDVGATLIFAASMFAMLRWPARIRTIAAGSMAMVAIYMLVRGLGG